MTHSAGAVPAATFADPPGFMGRSGGSDVPSPGPMPGVHASSASRCLDQAAFGLLLLAAGDLLFRPADLIPALSGAPIHKLLLIACTLLAMPRLMGLISIRALQQNAVATLLILLVPAVMLSHLVHGDIYGARVQGVEMAKSCLFAMLAITLASSTHRLRVLLAAIAVAVFAVAVLAVAQYHGLWHLDSLTGVDQPINGPEGRTKLFRLCGIGLFNDPNDFSLVLVSAILVCGYGLGERRVGLWRLALFVPLGVLVYALYLTHSRGGAISGAAALGALLAVRLGWRSVLLVAVPASLLLLVPLIARQMSLNLADPDDTFQARLRLWSGSLDAFASSPIIGIGAGGLIDVLGQVAHNSFLHAFAEMGVVGGGAFLGAFVVVGRALWRFRSSDGQLARIRPYVLAIVIGHAVGLLSLSRCYTGPTQMVLALGTVVLTIASRGGIPLPRADWRCLRGIALASVIFLVAMSIFVRLVMVQVEP
jgi:O-antigen ligase